MAKSKKYLDLTIRREVTDTLRVDLEGLLKVDEVPSAAFSLKYLSSQYASKYVDEDTDPADVRRHRAIVKWLGVERKNERTNTRLYTTDPFFKGLGYGHRVLEKAAKLVERTIGKSPPPDLLTRGSFSGGASTSVKRDVGAFAQKFFGKRDVTPRAWPRLQQAMAGFETWSAHTNSENLSPRLVRGNVLFTVPKTSVIDRVACKEPDYNVFGQKAIGDYFRRALRKRGINLNDQSINRSLALQGSVDGKLATIDLSSASDSMSISLVSLLLPKDWFDLLDALRCEKTFIDGMSHANAMFSSMGNAFTFELESLIFWALAWTVRDLTKAQGRISVYGDDIIVPSTMAGLLIQLLLWVGFTTNVQKTFYRGPFRESCGGHYYGGTDVTPFYLRHPLKDVSDLILFLNQYRRWLIVTGWDCAEGGWETSNRFTQLWIKLSKFVPPSLWGGYDLASRTQLVSPGPQKCELVAQKRRREDVEQSHGVGLYLSRLSGYKDTGDNPEHLESKLYQPTGEYAIRRCVFEPRVFGVVRPLFAYEQAKGYDFRVGTREPPRGGVGT